MSIDFIPLNLYTPLYFYIMGFIVLVTVFHCLVLKMDDDRNVLYIKYMGYITLVFVILYMGLRPISGVFTDMKTYYYIFVRYQQEIPLVTENDYFFRLFMWICTKTMSASGFFFICAILYIVPLFQACRKWFSQYWFYGFLMLIISMSFWAYGVNGIRNGIATSLLLYAMSCTNKKLQIGSVILSVSFHLSMLLPIIAFGISFFYKKTNTVLLFWFLCIVLSLILGSFFQNIFSLIGIDNERMSYFTDEVDQAAFSRIGFRWDFLIYSFIGIFAGWYFIFKKKFLDSVYIQLFNTYIFTNSIWILIIRANFSNRFAYLSWFMLGVIVVYPLLKESLFQHQNRIIGAIIVIYYLITLILVLL